MVSCFRQSGSAPSLEKPIPVEAIEISFDIIHQFPNFCTLDPENLTESLELIRETAREASRETWPWMWCPHKTHWHLSCAHKNHKTNLKTNKHIVTEQSWNRKCMKASWRYSRKTISVVSCSMSIAKMVWGFLQSVRPRDVFSFEAGHRRV